MINCVICFRTIEAYPCECGANMTEGAKLFTDPPTKKSVVPVTVAEFGAELFEAVQVASRRLAALEAVTVEQKRGNLGKVQDLQKTIAACDEKLRVVLASEKIATDDLRKILALGDSWH